MKILILTMDVGNNAPGIVFERIIQGLSKIHSVDLVTAVYEPTIDLSDVKNRLVVKGKYKDQRIHQSLVSIFGINPLDWWWSKEIISLINKKKNNEYDLVFSLTTFHHCAALIAGVLYTNNHPCKLAVYAVDAIPAPIGWSKNDFYFRGVKRMMTKYLPKADFLFSSNEQMLNYQLSTFTPKSTIKTAVIYNPSFGKMQRYDYSKTGKNVFLYTGGLYLARKPKYVLEAFKRLLNEYPDSTLEFVGSRLPENSLSIFNESDIHKIIVHPFTNDLKPYYEKATALIDIDADFPDDVYLSSKITNYIIINRTIITQTGVNSPSRKIFKGIASILQCGHDVNEITDAMRKAIQQKGRVDFNDRAAVISLFDLDSVASKLDSIISE